MSNCLGSVVIVILADKQKKIFQIKKLNGLKYICVSNWENLSDRKLI